MKRRKLTAKQLDNAETAMRYLVADWETMSTEADSERARSVGNGIKVLERLIAEASQESTTTTKTTLRKETHCVTYQRIWDENEVSYETKTGRIVERPKGWVYEVRDGGEYIDNFDSLRAVKAAYPNAKPRKADD